MRLGHAIALGGALLLLLVMAMDWYTTVQGEEARRIEEITDNPSGATAGEIDRRLNEDAGVIADRETDKAWEADAVIDRIILGFLIATILLAILVWLTRAMGGKTRSTGLGPVALCALFATGSAVLVAYRIIQEPGLDAGTHVKAGPVIALFLLGGIALGTAQGLRADVKEAESAAAE